VLKTLFCPPGVGQHVIVKWVFPAQIPGFSVTKVKFYVTSIARPLLVPVTSPKNQTILSLYSVILYVRPQPRLQRVPPSLPEEGHGNGHILHKPSRGAGWEENEYANSVRIDHCCRNQIVIQFDLRGLDLRRDCNQSNLRFVAKATTDRRRLVAHRRWCRRSPMSSNSSGYPFKQEYIGLLRLAPTKFVQ
jgi:hypothetical protein